LLLLAVHLLQLVLLHLLALLLLQKRMKRKRRKIPLMKEEEGWVACLVMMVMVRKVAGWVVSLETPKRIKKT